MSARRPFQRYESINYDDDEEQHNHRDDTASDKASSTSGSETLASEGIPEWSDDESSLTASECRFINDDEADFIDVKHYFPKGYYSFFNEH